MNTLILGHSHLVMSLLKAYGPRAAGRPGP